MHYLLFQFHQATNEKKYGQMAGEFFKLYPVTSDADVIQMAKTATRDQSRVSIDVWSANQLKLSGLYQGRAGRVDSGALKLVIVHSFGVEIRQTFALRIRFARRIVAPGSRPIGDQNAAVLSAPDTPL